VEKSSKNFNVLLSFIILGAIIVFLVFPVILHELNRKPLLAKVHLIMMTSMIIQYYDKFDSYPNSLNAAIKHEGGIKFKGRKIEKPYPDPYTGSDKVLDKYDGTGGWVFSSEKGIIGMNFRPFPYFSPTEINWKAHLKKKKKSTNY
jgi:hypothetical protein